MQLTLSILFIILYIFANELTYMVAVHQQEGLCKHIIAGDLCWLNRIIMAIPCIWYGGWIFGILLIAFSLFGLAHGTVGWVLSLASVYLSEDKLIHYVDIECGLLIPANIICLAFAIVSFFLTPFKSVLILFDSIMDVIVLSAILIIGFIIRSIISRLSR